MLLGALVLLVLGQIAHAINVKALTSPSRVVALLKRSLRFGEYSQIDVLMIDVSVQGASSLSITSDNEYNVFGWSPTVAAELSVREPEMTPVMH